MALAPSVQRLGQLVQLRLDGEYYTVLADAVFWAVIVSNIIEVRARYRECMLFVSGVNVSSCTRTLVVALFFACLCHHYGTR